MIETTSKLLHLIKIELFLALFPTGFFILTNMHLEIIAIILWLLIIDTILGVTVAIKYKKVSSYKMIKAIYKFLLYIFALSTAYLISCLKFPIIDNFYYYVGSFIAVTEALSNFEKLALLGFVLPKKLLSDLNIDFKEENIEKILDKK